jgi:hypothetical protein
MLATRDRDNGIAKLLLARDDIQVNLQTEVFFKKQKHTYIPCLHMMSPSSRFYVTHRLVALL